MSKRKAKAALALSSLLIASIAPLASAETIQKANLRIAFDGAITPTKLPREGTAPVSVSVSTEIKATNGKAPPQLKQIQIQINRHGVLDATGLPVCREADIQPATTEKALEACGDALVGQGYFAATVALDKRTTFPSKGKMFAFNGTHEGKPAILAHVYGSEPVPTSFTLPFTIKRSKGTFGTTLTATFPRADGSYVTGLGLDLKRTYTFKGKRRSYASAGCPAPKGFPGATFSFAKASYAFVGGKRLSSTLTRSCGVR